MITLKKQGNEAGTYIVQIKFKDEDDNLVTPYNLTWWLSDVEGNPINNREDVSASAEDGIINVILSGNDLTPGFKIFTIKGNYDSTYGTNLPIRDVCKFYINNLLEENL